MLNSVKTIIYKDAENNKTILPIKCFYQSINLEHITSNDPNILDEDLKSIKAKDFRNYFKNKPSDFYSLINSLSLIGYDYETSWNRIDLENKSFERMANIKYLIDWIVSVAQKHLINQIEHVRRMNTYATLCLYFKGNITALSRFAISG